MKVDYFKNNNDKISTYWKERGEACHSNKKIAFQFRKIERDIIDVNDIKDLSSKYEIKVLDTSTGLHEMKYDQIRVIHFIYLDNTFVYLGTFLKKSGKSPQTQIDKNNNRIINYLKNKEKEKHEKR